MSTVLVVNSTFYRTPNLPFSFVMPRFFFLYMKSVDIESSLFVGHATDFADLELVPAGRPPNKLQ